MSVFAWVSVVASLSVAPCDLKRLDAIVTNGSTVTVGDVMDVSCLSPAHRDQAAGLVIARLPAAYPSLTLTRSAVKSLVHRRAPGISFVPSPDDENSMAFVREIPSLTPASVKRMCAQAARGIETGQVVSGADLMSVPCDESANARNSITFDRNQKVLRALQPIVAGDKLGRLEVPAAAFDKGDELTLSVSLGSVQIARKVVAVQAAPAGARIFVRDESGAVFAAPTIDPKLEDASQ